MRKYDHFIITSVLLSICAVAIAQNTRITRCFSMTWLGPRFNEESIFLNATCQDATRLATGIPCQEPLVVSRDGTWPDMEYIWRHHSEQASCVLADNDVCAQYSYYFNGHVENSTYMCTRAVNSNGDAITNGCFEQRNGSFVTRVCFCRSVAGGFPCNDATTLAAGSMIVLLSALTLITNKHFVKLCLNTII